MCKNIFFLAEEILQCKNIICDQTSMILRNNDAGAFQYGNSFVPIWQMHLLQN